MACFRELLADEDQEVKLDLLETRWVNNMSPSFTFEISVARACFSKVSVTELARKAVLFSFKMEV